ncbi:hypothetical protein L6R52_16760, partial [Myxococcota bacterium]|nr:hypothetical protein [Myxococcota bacterium]
HPRASVPRRGHASALVLSALTACSSPPPPVVPPRDVVGPPREAAIECTPPTAKFAQQWFRLADLDTGTSCEVFVEQDECIVAIFRDCTTPEPELQRSWQGTIDHDMEVALRRTRQSSASTPARTPIDCRGLLEKPADGPTWVKLHCRLMSGSADPVDHRGLYLEAVPADAPVPPLATIGPAVSIATAGTHPEDWASDVAVLPAAGELWATIAGGAQDPATGLYVGRTSASRLEKLAAPTLAAPRTVRATKDEAWVFVSDDGALFRVNARTKEVAQTGSASEPIRDVAILDAGVLYATELMTRPVPSSRLVLIDPATLGTIATATVAGVVLELVPVESSGDLALLAFEGEEQIAIVDASLRVIRRVELGDVPSALAFAHDRGELAFAITAPQRLAVVDLATGQRTWELRVPEAGELRALWWDAERGLLLTGARGGLVTAIDLEGRRPLVQSRLALDGTVSRLRPDPSTGVIWALRGAAGTLEPLVPSE